ncbi:hypothetical protein G7Y89_g4233 [Cudoniella acicularis]|uniref:Heterokaryon incompatibility domain-containing protein n=1 Tax=Cudoniella acicularis TaxID=354080 RepID=A0A8H4RPW4_9HELO|nr:hypothetical protein G7Y89_g4233 [Cudoniella acicularis]
MEQPETREAAESHIAQIRQRRGLDTESSSPNINLEDLEASVSILSKELYEKSTHFLMELIQNADDCSYNVPKPTLYVTYWNGRLRVDYNEVGFRRNDVEALCRVGRSTKSKSGDQIGEKGIGFKSVFKIADLVWISSFKYSFKFDKTQKLGMITPQWAEFPGESRPGFTSIMLQISKDYNREELLQEMKSMDPKCLMFLRKLREISMARVSEDNASWTTTLGRTDEEAGDGSRRITRLNHNDQTQNYLVSQHTVKTLPPEPKRPGRTESAIMLAFPIASTQEALIEPQQVYSFLPVRDYGFNRLRTSIREKLLHSPVLESEGGQMITPISVRYVPDSFRDEDHIPLILSSKTRSKYLSRGYSSLDWNRLKSISVKELSEEEFLDDLQDFTMSCNDFTSISERWHSQIAKALIPLMATYKYSRKVMEMPLIPLQDGRWVSASVGTIFSPGNEEKITVPQGIEVFEIRRGVQKDTSRRHLFNLLGVKPFSVSVIHKLVLSKHSDPLPSLVPSRAELISQAVFLYKSQWTNVENKTRLRVATETGALHRAPEVYLDDATELHSASQYFRGGRKKFPFLHKRYYEAVMPEEQVSWVTWLHKELGMWKIPRLIKNPNSSPELSDHFQFIIDTQPSWRFLVLLRDNWNIYSEYFSHSSVQNRLESAPVSCRDHSLRKLGDTSTGYFLPKGFNPDIRLLLDIPDPEKEEWAFLANFGVNIRGNVGIYLSSLAQIQGSEVSNKFVTLLYDEIQVRYNDNPARVRHRKLFIGFLEIKDANLQTLVSEAKEITARSSLPVIIAIFKEIDKHLQDNSSAKNAAVINPLLSSEIFPVDEGDGETGFDDLCSGAASSEWYIADRPHFQKIFRGAVSLLAFTVEDVLQMARLITALGFEKRLLSKVASSALKTKGEVQPDRKYTDTFRAKSMLIVRLMPESLPDRERTLVALKNLKVNVANQILLSWTVTSLDPHSEKQTVEGHEDDNDLRAMVTSSSEEQAIIIYLKNGTDSACFPLELGEQLADICGIKEEHRSLLCFMLNEDNLSYIDACLDRRGIPKAKDKGNANGKREGGDAEHSKNGMAPGDRETEKGNRLGEYQQRDTEGVEISMNIGDIEIESGPSGDAQSKYQHIDTEDPEIDIAAEDWETEGEEAQVSLSIEREKVERNAPQILPTAKSIKFDSQPPSDSSLRKQTANENRYLAPSHDTTSRRPNYISLSDTPKIQASVLDQGQAIHMPIIKASTNSSSLGKFGWPRIVGTPNMVFVPNSQELPPPDFSEGARDGKMLPGRVQISQAGDCTVFVAADPNNKVDIGMTFLGELFVRFSSQILVLCSDRYSSRFPSSLKGILEGHTIQTFIGRVICAIGGGHAPFEQPGDAMATFTLFEVPALTKLLIQSSFEEAEGWKWNCPVYHIQVQTTVGGQESPFTMSAAMLEMARRFRIPEAVWTETENVFILVRVSDINTGAATASFFVDPWRLYSSGEMQVRAQNDSYVFDIRRASPQLAFRNFERNEQARRTNSHIHRFLRNNFGAFKSFLENPNEVSDRTAFRGDEQFMYKPLGGGRIIRLLRLYPGHGRAELKGVLYHVWLDSAEPFQAISYVWGNSLKLFNLKTPEGSIPLTVSLYLGLKRLRERDRAVVLWADAICIDQDNNQEKGHQILIMSEIFKSAKCVYAWLGEGADKSSLAIDCLLEIRARSQRSSQSSAVTIPSAENPVWNVINKFFSREWFQRVWVVQELVLASEVIMVCGQRMVQWDQIYIPAKICSEQARKSTAGLMKPIAQTAAAMLSLGDLRRRYRQKENHVGRELLTLFESFQHTQATRQRDKLFAFLGLACDSDDPGFDPDYDSNLEVIVRRYAGVFVRRGRGMELLYRAGGLDLKSHRFPSWIPNWMANTYPKTITTWPNRSGNFSTCTRLQSRICLSPKNDAVLNARAYLIDSIVKVGTSSFQTTNSIFYLKELFRVIESFSSYPNGDNPKDLVWRIPIGDASKPASGSWKEVDFRASYQALTEYLQLGEEIEDWKTEVMKIRAVAKVKQFLFRPQELRQLLWLYLNTAQEFAERFSDAKVCVTSRGYIGIVPATADKGDIVSVFHGSAVPFVIRESTTNYGSGASSKWNWELGMSLRPWASGPNKDYSQNKNYNIGVGILMAWPESVTNATMVLSQDNFPGDGACGPFITLETGLNGTSWSWTVSYAGLDPNYHNVYYFSLGGNGNSGAISHYFNISGTEAETLRSSSSSATFSSTQSPSARPFASSAVQTSASDSTSTISPTTTVTQEATSQGSIQAGTVAGIAVGVVAGVLLLIGALWWAWKYKTRRDTAAASRVQGVAIGGSRQQYGPSAAKLHETGGNQIHEIPGSLGRRFFEPPDPNASISMMKITGHTNRSTCCYRAARGYDSGLEGDIILTAQQVNPGMQLAMLMGIYGQQGDTIYTCSTGNYTFPNTETLGFCACQNVKNDSRIHCGSPISSGIPPGAVTSTCKITTPGGLSLTNTASQKWWTLLNSVTWQEFPLEEYNLKMGNNRTSLARLAILINFGNTWETNIGGQLSVNATVTECSIQLCERVYRALNVTSAIEDVSSFTTHELSILNSSINASFYTPADFGSIVSRAMIM